jgi:hypothetical protein
MREDWGNLNRKGQEHSATTRVDGRSILPAKVLSRLGLPQAGSPQED